MKILHTLIALSVFVNICNAQDLSKAKKRKYSKNYPDWIIMKSSIDTITCKIFWYDEKMIALDRKGGSYMPEVINKLLISNFKIESKDAMYVDSTIKIVIDEFGKYSFERRDNSEMINTQPINVNLGNTIPMRNDNLIVIVGDSSTDYNYNNFGKYLISQGFSYSSKDFEFKTLQTEIKTSKGAYQYILQISFIDSFINIRARCTYLQFKFGYSYSVDDLNWTDWIYLGNGSAPDLAYRNFIPILRGYSNKLYFFRR